jgi:hypothetical protein
VNLKNLALYAVSTAAVTLTLVVLNVSATTFGVIYAVSFWTLLGLDFFISQVKENGQSEVQACQNNGPAGTSLVDRFFAYLLAAPFIAPARLYQLASK